MAGNARSGVRPQPTALKLLKGTRESRINRSEPRPRVSLPKLDEDASPAVRKVWDRVLAELVVMGIAHAADQDTLRAYCETVVSYRKTCRIMANADVLMKGLHGGVVKNPAVGIQERQAKLLVTLAQEFGLTPSARSRIDAGLSKDLAEVANPFSG